MTQIINIDDLLASNEPATRIVYKGETYESVNPTVEDYLANLRDEEAMKNAVDPSEAILIAVRMVARAFPTIGEEKLREWPLSLIQKMLFGVSEMDRVAEDTKDVVGKSSTES